MSDKSKTIAAIALGLLLTCPGRPSCAQAPDWMMPLGAKVVSSPQGETTSRPTRLPSTAWQQLRKPSPKRLGGGQLRSPSLPLPSATPGRIDLPEPIDTMQTSDIELLSPQSAAPTVITISKESIAETSFDAAALDRSIKSSMQHIQTLRLVPRSGQPIAAKPSDENVITISRHNVAETALDRAAFDRAIESSIDLIPELGISRPDAPQVFPQASTSTVRLLTPHSPDQPLITIRRQDLERTEFDRGSFDQAIDASLSSHTLWPHALPTSPQEEIPLGRTLPRDGGGEALPCETCAQPHVYYDDFSPTPVDADAVYDDSGREQWVYDAKFDVPTQHPWVEWGRIFYGNGITPRGRNWFGEKNLARPRFYLYGDYRTGIQAARNAGGRADNWAHRLNLDMDLQLTDTERFHGFVGPIDKAGRFTRLERIGGDYRFQDEIDFTPVTGYFEGDAGVLLGSAGGITSPFELPVTIGLVPLLFQNGIWMEDAVTGAAFSLPARHSRLLNWSNYDATFFAVFDQLNSAAFANEHSAQAFGTAWFIEAYGGYIESGYAYVRDRNFQQLSYHNITASFTRRYFDRISNSVRVIVNTGQDLPACDRTADGVLLLCENSWITASPLRLVPYANFFVGWDRPQSVARAGVSGGILRNTGINFDTDFLNGFPTLDPTASDTAGGSLGVDLIGGELDRQLLVEATYLTPHGNRNAAVPDDQFALGARYQIAVTNATLWRFDLMHGWRRGLADVYGTRMEYRWKF